MSSATLGFQGQTSVSAKKVISRGSLVAAGSERLEQLYRPLAQHFYGAHCSGQL